jgi:hypothetical protein
MLKTIAALAFCLGGYCAFAQSSQPTSSGQTPTNQGTAPRAPEQRGTDEAPISVKILPADEAKDKADQDKRERAEKALVDKKAAFETQRIADYTLWLSALTGGLVVIAFGQAVLFWYQLRLIREGLADSKKAAEAAEESTSISRTAFTQLQRPWIFVELSPQLGGSSEDELEPYAVFDIVNHGRMPALIEECHGEISQAELGPEHPILRDEFTGILGPGKAMERSEIYCPVGFKYGVIVDISGGVSAVYPEPTIADWSTFLYIVFRYRGVNDGEYTSSFCWRYDTGMHRWAKFEESPGEKKYNYLT